MSRRNRIRTLLYGDQRLLPGELDLLSTQSLQRLYDLHQLGLADRVFLDASHSRLHHVVGVLEQVERLTGAIVRNLRSTPSAQFWLADGKEPLACVSVLELVDRSKPVARLIGLLHDLTHAPFGHTVEDEIELISCKHDDPTRQADAFYRLLCQYIGWLGRDGDVPRGLYTPPGEKNSESPLSIPHDLSEFLNRSDTDPPPDWKAIADFAVRLLTEPSSVVSRTAWRLSTGEVALLLSRLHIAMTALLHIELLHKNDPEEKYFPRLEGYDFQRLIDRILNGLPWFDYGSFEQERFEPHRDAYLLDIVGNTVCADLLDYAKRDAHFTNIKLDYDEERIADNFTIVCWNAAIYSGGDDQDRRTVPNEKDPFGGLCLRTAISLFSHKFRIDVPGELMNLLNVRFYIYERVLFHPTKCAAGAMLGTALQLIGWRPLGKYEAETEDLLPTHLRHIGDAVFLHDVSAGARLALQTLSGLTETSSSDAAHLLEEVNWCPQVQIARELLNRRSNADIDQAKTEIRAGLDLLDRLQARRYFRPVFRALPNAYYEDSDRGANDLAAVFRNAQRRFQAERNIEKNANLRPGTVVIHCPPRSPAQKIANVLLFLPREGKEPKVRKLRHISEIDQDVFGQHQKAIEAVEKMYSSMWRLVVYVSPRYLSRYDEIQRIAGEVVIQTLNDALNIPVKGGDDARWPNDPQLERELRGRLEREEEPPASGVLPVGLSPETVADSGEALIAETVRQLAKELDPVLSTYLENSQLDPQVVKEGIISIGRKASRKDRVNSNGRNLESRFLVTCRAYYGKKLPDGMPDALKVLYQRKLSGLTTAEQVEFLDMLSQRIDATPKSAFNYPQKPFVEILDEIIGDFIRKSSQKGDQWLRQS